MDAGRCGPDHGLRMQRMRGANQKGLHPRIAQHGVQVRVSSSVVALAEGLRPCEVAVTDRDKLGLGKFVQRRGVDLSHLAAADEGGSQAWHVEAPQRGLTKSYGRACPGLARKLHNLSAEAVRAAPETGPLFHPWESVMSAKVYCLVGLVLCAALSVADWSLTWALIHGSNGEVYESNPVAAWCLKWYGWPGLALF